jgi:hypothetical protein
MRDQPLEARPQLLEQSAPKGIPGSDAVFAVSSSCIGSFVERAAGDRTPFGQDSEVAFSTLSVTLSLQRV